MKKVNLIIVFFIVTSSFQSCNNLTENAKKKENIAATINGNPIYLSNVDKEVKQELFDQLNRIYEIRKVSLDFLVNKEIINSEAKNNGLIEKEYLDKFYKSKITKSNLEKYIRINRYEDYIPVFKRCLTSLKTESDEGQVLLMKKFKDRLYVELIDSLKEKYNIKYSLAPPASPMIDTTGLDIHYRGNLDSKVVFIEISDFECESCIKNSKIFQALYERYKDKVKFGFCNYSNYPTISAIASECAANQDRFWEFHDKLFSLKSYADTSNLFDIASNLGLDRSKFIEDFNNKDISESIQKNILKISRYGIFGTPTILINNQLVFNSSSVREIESLLLDNIRLQE